MIGKASMLSNKAVLESSVQIYKNAKQKIKGSHYLASKYQ